MITTLMVFHAVVSILLILMVLLQFGKGAEAGLMSGGASDAVFTSGQQGSILSKITIFLSVLFLGNSIFLAKLQSNRSEKSLMDSEAPIARPLNSDAAVKKAEEKKAAVDEKNASAAPKAEATETKPAVKAVPAETQQE